MLVLIPLINGAKWVWLVVLKKYPVFGLQSPQTKNKTTKQDKDDDYVR